jgi:heme-degrading monooxygenase HmoA
MLKKYPGVKRVARYKILAAKCPQFIAVYHFDSLQDFEAFGKSPEFKAAIEEMNQSWPNGIEIISRQQSELIREW